MNTMHIYLLDDDPLGRELKKDLLSALDFKVSSFSSFEDAALSLKTESPNLILSDFCLNSRCQAFDFWALNVAPKRIPFGIWSGIVCDTPKAFSIKPHLSSTFKSQWTIFETTMKHHNQNIPLTYMENNLTRAKGLIPFFKKPCPIDLPLSYFNLVDEPTSIHNTILHPSLAKV